MVGAQDGDGLSELLHDHLYTNLFVANPVHDGLRFYGESQADGGWFYFSTGGFKGYPVLS